MSDNETRTLQMSDNETRTLQMSGNETRLLSDNTHERLLPLQTDDNISEASLTSSNDDNDAKKNSQHEHTSQQSQVTLTYNQKANQLMRERAQEIDSHINEHNQAFGGDVHQELNVYKRMRHERLQNLAKNQDTVEYMHDLTLYSDMRDLDAQMLYELKNPYHLKTQDAQGAINHAAIEAYYQELRNQLGYHDNESDSGISTSQTDHSEELPSIDEELLVQISSQEIERMRNDSRVQSLMKAYNELTNNYKENHRELQDIQEKIKIFNAHKKENEIKVMNDEIDIDAANLATYSINCKLDMLLRKQTKLHINKHDIRREIGDVAKKMRQIVK